MARTRRLRVIAPTPDGAAVKDNPMSGSSGDTATGMGAAITLRLTSGTYLLSVDGVGAGSPLDTGYSDYASVGAFTVAVVATSAS